MAFCVGRVLEPEIAAFKTKNGDKTKLTFGLLSGRTSTIFSVWSDDKAFEAAVNLKDGSQAIAIVGYGVDDSGKLRTYLNRIAPASDDLSDMLNSFFEPVTAQPK